MKLAIVGTRELSGMPIVVKAVKRFLLAYDADTSVIDEIVSGGARGVDRLAEHYAAALKVSCKVFEPKNGPAGGRPIVSVKVMMDIRNQEIVNYADAMVAIRLPDQSPGTDDAIERMKAAGKPVAVFDLRPVFTEFFNGNRPPSPG